MPKMVRYATAFDTQYFQIPMDIRESSPPIFGGRKVGNP